MINPRPTDLDVLKLVDDLTARGMTMPGRIAEVRPQIRRLQALHQDLPEAPDPLIAPFEDVVAYCRELAALQAGAGTLQEAGTRMSAPLAELVRTDLVDGVDVLIDQLRPDFDRGVQAIADAFAAGLQPGDGPREVVAMTPAALGAYQGLVEATKGMSVAAETRLSIARITEELGDGLLTGRVIPFAACFTFTPSPWPTSRWLSSDSWLELALRSKDAPLRMMSAAETKRNLAGYRRSPQPMMLPDEDGGFRVNPGWGSADPVWNSDDAA